MSLAADYIRIVDGNASTLGMVIGQEKTFRRPLVSVEVCDGRANISDSSEVNSSAMQCYSVAEIYFISEQGLRDSYACLRDGRLDQLPLAGWTRGFPQAHANKAQQVLKLVPMARHEVDLSDSDVDRMRQSLFFHQPLAVWPSCGILPLSIFPHRCGMPLPSAP